MNDRFFPELSRRLKREGIDTAPVKKDCLPVLTGGKEAMWVQSWGGIILNTESVNDPVVNRVYDTVAGISAQVYEYTEAMAASPPLHTDGLHENFRLLAEFNGTVLAGQELEQNWGYKFATWQRTPDRTGVTLGHYYHNGYGEAKLDFACRSRLVQESRQFTDEQLTEMYRCIYETLDSEYPLTKERCQTLTEAANQIQRSVDDLEERVSLSNQRELEEGEQRTDSPGLEMRP